MLWPRKTSTRCLAQAALIARTALSESALVRSTPLISAPQADDSGVTSMSMTSCMGRFLRKMKALSRASCRLSSNRLCGGVVTSWMMLFTVSAASSPAVFAARRKLPQRNHAVPHGRLDRAGPARQRGVCQLSLVLQDGRFHLLESAIGWERPVFHDPQITREAAA